MRERVAASVPFIRFRVERELARGDLSSAEGKDLVVDALKPVFADLPPSAMRDELTELVAEQVGVGAAKLGEWLAQPRRAQAAAARAPRQPAAASQAPPAPRPLATQVVGPSARIERAFLIQCIALPSDGRVALDQIDLDEDLTVPAYRRAAALLRDAAGDERAAGARRTTRSSAASSPSCTSARRQATPSRAALEAERLRLQVERLERAINVSKHAGSSDLSQLVARREELRAEVERKVEETLAQSRGVE